MPTSGPLTLIRPNFRPRAASNDVVHLQRGMDVLDQSVVHSVSAYQLHLPINRWASFSDAFTCADADASVLDSCCWLMVCCF